MSVAQGASSWHGVTSRLQCLFLIISPFMIRVQSHQPPEFGRTFCEQCNLGPRSQGKNSPFMTSLLTTSPPPPPLLLLPPNHLSTNPLCPLDEDKPVIQLLHDTRLDPSRCPDIQVGCGGKNTWDTASVPSRCSVKGARAGPLSPAEPPEPSCSGSEA